MSPADSVYPPPPPLRLLIALVIEWRDGAGSQAFRISENIYIDCEKNSKYNYDNYFDYTII